MDLKETGKLIKLIRRSYPTFLFKCSAEEMTETIKVWWSYFKEYPFDLMQRALKQYALSDPSKYAPSVGQLNAIVVEMLNPISEEITPEQAWELGIRCIRSKDWYYNSHKVFDELPDSVKRAFGSCKHLRDIGYMNETQVQIERTQFLKNYKESLKLKRENLKDPKKAIAAYEERERKRLENRPPATAQLN